MTDNEIPIGAIRQRLQQFVASRQWEQYHSPKNLAMSIAIEVVQNTLDEPTITIPQKTRATLIAPPVSVLATVEPRLPCIASQRSSHAIGHARD